MHTHLTDRAQLLRQGAMVDATIIHTAPSTKSHATARDPQMHQTRKRNQWSMSGKISPTWRQKPQAWRHAGMEACWPDQVFMLAMTGYNLARMRTLGQLHVQSGEPA